MKSHAHRCFGAAREYAVLGVVLLAGAAVFLFTWSGSPLLRTSEPELPPIASVASDKPATPTKPATPSKTDKPAVAEPGTTATEPGVTPVSLRFGSKEPIKRTPGCIRVMTFNLENLFDDKDDPSLTGKSEDKTMTKPAEHCKAAAEAIKRCDADVVCVQEVESLEALTQFRDTYLKDAGYEHIVSIDTGDPRGIECSVLSRLPLKDVKVFTGMALGGVQPEMIGNEKNDFAGMPIVFKRSPLQVTVEVSAAKVAELAKAAGEEVKDPKPYRLTLFVVHHKSGRADFWREKEAAKTVELAQEIIKKDAAANVMVLGDCNAMLRDEALKIYERAGFMDLFKDRSAKDNEVVTHSSGRIIDHVFYNMNAGNEVQKKSRFVLAMPCRPEGFDWRTTPPPAGIASDHFPVVVDIKPVD